MGTAATSEGRRGQTGQRAGHHHGWVRFQHGGRHDDGRRRWARDGQQRSGTPAAGHECPVVAAAASAAAAASRRGRGWPIEPVGCGHRNDHPPPAGQRRPCTRGRMRACAAPDPTRSAASRRGALERGGGGAANQGGGGLDRYLCFATCHWSTENAKAKSEHTTHITSRSCILDRARSISTAEMPIYWSRRPWCALHWFRPRTHVVCRHNPFVRTRQH